MNHDSKDELRPEKRVSSSVLMKCIVICNQTIKQSPNYFNAYIVKASALEHLCRFSDSAGILVEVMDKYKLLGLPPASDFYKQCRISLHRVDAHYRRDDRLKNAVIGEWFGQLRRDRDLSLSTGSDFRFERDGLGRHAQITEIRWKVLNGNLIIEGKWLSTPPHPVPFPVEFTISPMTFFNSGESFQST